MDRLETLIDNLLIYLPADVPFLINLIERQEGRYIVFGLAVVIALLVVWTLLAILQMMFFGKRTEPVNNKTAPIELLNWLRLKIRLKPKPTLMGSVSLKNLKMQTSRKPAKPRR